jgi:hypothetical protein
LDSKISRPPPIAIQRRGSESTPSPIAIAITGIDIDTVTQPNRDENLNGTDRSSTAMPPMPMPMSSPDSLIEAIRYLQARVAHLETRDISTGIGIEQPTEGRPVDRSGRDRVSTSRVDNEGAQGLGVRSNESDIVSQSESDAPPMYEE